MESIRQFRFVVLAQSEQVADEFTKWLTESESKDGYYTRKYKNTEFIGYCRWPGYNKALPGAPANDAILIRIRNSHEWSELRDFVHEKSLVQFKVLIGDKDDDIQSVASEIRPTFTAKLSEKKSEEIFDELLKAEEDLDSLMESVFKNFDKSGDGYIDVNEMETMCRELGYEVTHTEFQETLNSLDVNKDNQISLEEFKDWYKKGRQCTQLMEKLVSMRIATNEFLNSYLSSKYLDFIKSKVDYLQKVKKELISSFVSLNIEKVKLNPDIAISLDGYFGGDVMETVSKSYVNNYDEGLKSTDIFVIVEFTLKDPSKIDHLQHFLSKLTDSMRDSFRIMSRKIFTFVSNDISIKVLKKNNETLCLSIKCKRSIKEEVLSIENGIRYLLDDNLTQTLNLSFCVSGNVKRVRDFPGHIFLDSFEPAVCLEMKAELLKKNIKLLTKYLKPIPRWLKFWLNSYGGSKIDLSFKLDYLKSFNTSLLKQPNTEIINFLKAKLHDVLATYLSPLGSGSLFKKFLEAMKENYTVVINTPQFHVVSRVDIAGLFSLMKD
jgi:hypothetical protein